MKYSLPTELPTELHKTTSLPLSKYMIPGVKIRILDTSIFTTDHNWPFLKKHFILTSLNNYNIKKHSTCIAAYTFSAFVQSFFVSS